MSENCENWLGFCKQLCLLCPPDPWNLAGNALLKALGGGGGGGGGGGLKSTV